MGQGSATRARNTIISRIASFSASCGARLLLGLKRDELASVAQTVRKMGSRVPITFLA
jgi:hypothetical protein